MEEYIKKILFYLPRHTSERIRSYLLSNEEAQKYLSEIRLRCGRPSSLSLGKRNVLLFSSVPDICTAEEISSTLAHLTEDSVHSYKETLREGFITLDGGYRIGVSGSANTSDGGVKGLYSIGSLNIRIPRAVTHIDGKLLSLLRRENTVDSALIYSPPGIGKTTLIRCLCLSLSSKTGALRVSVVDSRHEIYIKEMFSLSIADFLLGYPKAEGIEIATRTQCPEVIICDEIGGDDECEAILSAQNSGVPLIATAHAKSREELMRRPNIRMLIDAGVFSYLIGINRKDGQSEFEYDVFDMRHA